MLRLRLGEDWSAEELLDLARGAEVRLDFGRAASNGGGSFWNLEIEETTTPALGSTFYRVDVATPTAYLNTILTNSIFERSVSTAFDFGPYLDVASGPTRWVFDDGLGSIAINPTRVGIAGMRAAMRQQPSADRWR